MRVRKAVFEKYVETVGAGQLIFHEGDPGDVMYIIIEGGIEISKRTSDSSAKVLVTLGRGDIFGEMSIIEKKRRSATATATKRTRLLVMNEALFNSMIRTNADFAARMIRILSERLRHTNGVIEELLSSNRESQVLEGLREFAGKHGASSYKGLRVNREEFGRWASKHLGIPPEEVPDSLDRLLRKKLIHPSAAGEADVLLSDQKNAASDLPFKRPI